MKKIVIFDLDGTLIDSYKAIRDALNFTIKRFGKKPWKLMEVKKRVGKGLEILIEEAIGKEKVKEGVEIFREKYKEIFLNNTKVLPFVREVILALKERDIKLAIASNKPSDFTREILKNFGLEKYFDTILGPFEVKNLKPNPEMLEKILKLNNLRKEEALYVGDMILDSETAKNAGVDCILIASGGNSLKELKKTGFPVYKNLKEAYEKGGLYDS